VELSKKISNIGSVRSSGHRFRTLLQSCTIDSKPDRAVTGTCLFARRRRGNRFESSCIFRFDSA
jgi:hypothetical protein